MGKKKLDKGSRNTIFFCLSQGCFFMIYFRNEGFILTVFFNCILFNFQTAIWCIIRAAISDKTSCCNICTWEAELHMCN